MRLIPPTEAWDLTTDPWHRKASAHRKLHLLKPKSEVRKTIERWRKTESLIGRTVCGLLVWSDNKPRVIDIADLEPGRLCQKCLGAMTIVVEETTA